MIIVPQYVSEQLKLSLHAYGLYTLHCTFMLFDMFIIGLHEVIRPDYVQYAIPDPVIAF